jgi:hypothetical protein
VVVAAKGDGVEIAAGADPSPVGVDETVPGANVQGCKDEKEEAGKEDEDVEETVH